MVIFGVPKELRVILYNKFKFPDTQNGSQAWLSAIEIKWQYST